MQPRQPARTEHLTGACGKTSAADWVREQVTEAVSKGASACIDPTLSPASADNTPYLAPQVLVGVNHNMSVMTEESFGPVVGIMPVTNDEEAIHLMNDSDLGLTAPLWKQDQLRAEQIGEQFECSTFRVGLPSTHSTQIISPGGCLGNLRIRTYR